MNTGPALSHGVAIVSLLGTALILALAFWLLISERRHSVRGNALTARSRSEAGRPRPTNPPTIKSRYADDPRVVIDAAKVPQQLRDLIPLAKQWSIGDDVELSDYIDWVSLQDKRRLVDAFAPHIEAWEEWHASCAQLRPQPDELVLFDTAVEAVATVMADLDEGERSTEDKPGRPEQKEERP